MKIKLAVPALCALVLMGCNKTKNEQTFQLDVELNKATKDPYALVIDSSTTDMGHVDTLSVLDGKLSFTKNLDQPLHMILMSTTSGDYIDFFAEGEPIKLVCDNSLSNAKMESKGKNNALYQEYKTQRDSINKAGESILQTLYKDEMNEVEATVYNQKVIALNNEIELFRKQFIKLHPESPVSAYLIFKSVPLDNLEQLKAYYAMLDKSLETHPYAQIIKRAIDRQQKIAKGQPAPEFSATDTDGKEVKLSDYRGKYVFLDFWASWCAPCRREIPHIIQAYQKYHKNNFDVLGLSLDFEQKELKTAVATEKIPWKNIFVKDFTDQKIDELYGIQAIPRNFLIDPNGIIIKRNMYGDELEKTLSEIFKSK